MGFCIHISHWVGLLVLCHMSCAQALCPPYPAPSNAQVSSVSSNPAGVSVVISCNIGYAAIGLATPACVLYPPVADSGGYTAAQGNRSTEQRAGYQLGAQCVGISCGRYAAPRNGKVVPPGDISYGQYASIVCDPGFRAVGMAGSSENPACEADGSFGIGKGCERILLVCLSSVSTSTDVIPHGHQTYQNETCHEDTQFCVTAVKGTTVWRGCGPPVVKIGEEVVPHKDWLEQVQESDLVIGRQSSAWLSSHFVCKDDKMQGLVDIAASAYGGGSWKYTCCCSILCNAGFKCVQGEVGTELQEETSDIPHHTECPPESEGCYSILASGDATGWKVVDKAKYKLASIANSDITGTVVFETTSGRPPDLGEEMIGNRPKARVSTDSWPASGTSVQFIDVSPESQFPYEAEVKAWSIYARAPGTLRLHVWRKSDPSDLGSNLYTLIGQNTVTVTDNFAQTAIFLSNNTGGQILVKQGDMIGWSHDGPGILEYEARSDGLKLMRFNGKKIQDFD